ncbi:MAG: 30S ribosomal protein S8e [Candidatus ainarchaeum sp.]|nr:30S ribosomal protein S8e [Candidatus ainarchaeum sp.]
MVEEFHGRGRTKRGGTGGKRRAARGKRLAEIGGAFAATKVDKQSVLKKERTLGGGMKGKLKKAAFANVLTKNGFRKAAIKRVLESPDNRHYARMNVITKGSLIETEIGNARVTSRPGQSGLVNAVLVGE